LGRWHNATVCIALAVTDGAKHADFNREDFAGGPGRRRTRCLHRCLGADAAHLWNKRRCCHRNPALAVRPGGGPFQETWSRRHLHADDRRHDGGPQFRIGVVRYAVHRRRRGYARAGARCRLQTRGVHRSAQRLSACDAERHNLAEGNGRQIAGRLEDWGAVIRRARLRAPESGRRYIEDPLRCTRQRCRARSGTRGRHN
jgi:hypothetical protein